MERLERSRHRPGEIVPVETARQLAALSRETNRQLGLLLDRKGAVVHLLLGDAKGVTIPDLTRFRLGPGRLRGLRLIHTHLSAHGFSQEDLTDLATLRLDLMVAIEVGEDGIPGRTHLAYLMPAQGARQTLMSFPTPHDLPPSPLSLIEEVESELTKRMGGRATGGSAPAILVGWTRPGRQSVEDSMVELAELARTAGIAVADSVIQRRPKPDPQYLVGQGKLKDITLRAMDLGADTLVFNGELTSSQLRAVTDATELKVIDRTMLILDIFAQHAHSRGGKIQVELAQLRYLLPRLMGKGTALSRLAGGIGTRGPGETKLEVDRRRIRKRIGHLERDLEKLQTDRRTRRRKRGASERPIVSVVGYTNVGKSTLLNTLTKSSETAEDKLFATLDPVSRRLSTPEGHLCVVTDTVGLISGLPPELKKAFAATFEEIEDADLILHLADASSPAVDDQVRTVEETLSEMGLSRIPRMMVLNKGDMVDPEILRNLERRYESFAICARDRRSLGPLIAALRDALAGSGPDKRVALTPGSGLNDED